jgi:hypothetical protein
MIFDLLFIVVVLATVVMLTMAAIAGLRGRRQRATALLLRCGVVAAVYVGAVAVVSLLSPQRVLAIGEDWCFDDWCVAVDSVTFASELGPSDHPVQANGVFYVVRLRLSNHARGRPQRASSAAVHLLDGLGHRYEVSQEGQRAYEAQDGPTPPLTTTVPIGESVTTIRLFDLPRDARGVGLTVEHPVGLSPSFFIIGDQASLFHRRTVVRLN